MLPVTDAFVFWLVTAAMTALALAFVLPRLVAPRAGPARAHFGALNAAIYRSELADLDRQRAESPLTDAQYAAAREELERRLLSDVAGDSADSAPATPPRGTVAIMAVALPALAFGLYALLGNPALPGSAPTTASVASEGPDGLPVRRADLVRHLARNARDGRAWIMLARMDFAADRFDDAAASFRKALEASPKVAGDAGIWCEYADALGMQQGGTLAGQPRDIVMHALALDARHPKALEMAGSAAYEQRDFAGAVRYWQRLLEQLPERTARHRELALAIARVERLTLVAGGAPDARR